MGEMMVATVAVTAARVDSPTRRAFDTNKASLLRERGSFFLRRATLAEGGLLHLGEFGDARLGGV